MTEEIMNSDGSRNWQANILLDNIKRLEQENGELKEHIKLYVEQLIKEGEQNVDAILEHAKLIKKYKSALEEIREIILTCKDEYCCDRCKYDEFCRTGTDEFPDVDQYVINKINEVLDGNRE